MKLKYDDDILTLNKRINNHKKWFNYFNNTAIIDGFTQEVIDKKIIGLNRRIPKLIQRKKDLEDLQKPVKVSLVIIN